MSFRILNQAPVYLLANGQPAAGGSLTFYETDLSTLKDTWSDEALTTLNSNPVLLDASGRTVTDVWGDEEEYGAVLKNSLGVEQWTRNNIRANEPQVQTIPVGTQVGDLLQWDGSAWIAVQGILVPDPTDLNNHQLESDGTSVPIWAQKPEPYVPPTPEYDVQAGFIRIGTLLDQWGSGTAPAAAGLRSSSVNITFAEPFSAAPYHCSVEISNAGGSTSTGAICTHAVTNLTATGMTVTVNMPDDDTQPSWDLNNATPFTYRVVGPTTVDE